MSKQLQVVSRYGGFEISLNVRNKDQACFMFAMYLVESCKLEIMFKRAFQFDIEFSKQLLTRYSILIGHHITCRLFCI